MPISEKQANENAQLYQAAMADRVKARVTGKYIKKDPETDEWVTGEEVPAGRHLKLRWGWQGHTYGADEKGYIRQIIGRKPKQKPTDKTVLIFGDDIPLAGLIHHRQILRTMDGIQDRFEVVTDEEAAEAESGEAKDSNGGGGSGDLGPAPAKKVYQMNKEELVSLGVEKGLGTKEELESQTVPALRDLLKEE